VGQYGIDFCDKTLAAVAFTLRNAHGEGDYFDGIPPTCAAPDDLDRQLGDPAEGSLAEALHYVRAGTCGIFPTEPASGTRRAARGARVDQGLSGLGTVIGAW
jgi:hypothetical protein